MVGYRKNCLWVSKTGNISETVEGRANVSIFGVNLPHCSGACDDPQHKHALADYYADIIHCMKKSTYDAIPWPNM